jgi:TolB-like protein/tetratricopeptide (TPR) repeat protein
MKKCPHCKRVYTDVSFDYCLDDGEVLVYGPGRDGAETAILSGGPSSEANTVHKLASDKKDSDYTPATSSRSGFRKVWILAAVSILVLTATAAAVYRYYFSPADVAIRSVAVMPFVNSRGDPSIDYLSDGITESLINSFSRLPNIKVIARSSVFRYKGADTDLAKIASELGVQAVMTGRIIQLNDKLDIRVELIDATNNTHLWGERFIRDASDIFAVQDEIAQQATDNLRVRLTGTQQDKITKRYTTNAEAYRLYLQGRYFLNDFSEESLTKAIQYFDQAIAEDPKYALAYAARSDCYMQSGDLSLAMAEAIAKARHDSTAALAIDPELEEARTVQAEIKFQFDWDFAESEKDFKAAIASNPNYAESHHQYAWYLAMTGRLDESLDELKLAQQLDPVNPPISIDTCVPYTFAQQWDKCIEQSRSSLQMFPNFYLAHMTLGTSLFAKGDEAGGLEELKIANAMEHTPHLVGVLGYYYAKAGHKDEARKALAELEEMSKHRFVASYWMAAVHAGLGENDEAFSWLEKSYNERSWWMMFLKMDPIMEPLHTDPRYSEMIKRIGFPN